MEKKVLYFGAQLPDTEGQSHADQPHTSTQLSSDTLSAYSDRGSRSFSRSTSRSSSRSRSRSMETVAGNLFYLVKTSFYIENSLQIVFFACLSQRFGIISTDFKPLVTR
jgi:hypothetical protein